MPASRAPRQSAGRMRSGRPRWPGPDRPVVEPRVLEELISVRCMVLGADAEVKCAPCLLGFVVAADVVTEEVVGEQQVPRTPFDLLGLGQVNRRVGAEQLRAVVAEVRGVRQVRSRPEA